jgi:hypothetical protein
LVEDRDAVALVSYQVGVVLDDHDRASFGRCADQFTGAKPLLAAHSACRLVQ